ncbi:S8 family peptidase [Bacteroides ihuae]|uniref:S8 family peptidase n=1 Tax=Bacteroides ihuae TaxID=1852362 RepID=UPI0008DA8BA6|nr:S8 family peptidase [Bacteroides ihuae]
MAKKNFLLGKGERLTEDVRIKSGGANKVPPYTFSEAKERLQPMLSRVVEDIKRMPDDTCPNDYVVATMTLNPEYLAKSYYPSELLRSVGLNVVGSRSRSVIPEKKSKNREPVQAATTELFIIGKRLSFRKWSNELSNWDGSAPGAEQIVEIEELNFPAPSTKIKNIKDGSQTIVYEVVLHLNEEVAEAGYLNLFKLYLQRKGITASFQKRFYGGGLCFLELEASADLAEYIASFSLVRVLRAMPSLRLLRPTIRSGESAFFVNLPDVAPIDPSIKVAIFDGGIPRNHPICKWATLYEIEGIEASDPELLEHGVSVTSAFLFGHIDPKKTLPQPYSYVDHYRVLDNSPGQNPFELYEVLDRISNVLATNKYDFLNLSLGPCLPVDDDDVHAWTAVLDEYLSKGLTLATIAVGNDGEADPAINANRVQVPSDCVNALGVGACDVPDSDWQRASYSSIGPGRSPGLIKPDLVDFGGSCGRPFLTLDYQNGNHLLATGGTSFSAPSVLRLGAGIRAHFGSSLNPLAIRALLVHCAENESIPNFEIGWGRVSRTLDDIVICDDHIMRVVFQGRISASKFLRAPIPLPNDTLTGKVTIKATLCYVTNIDPHHPDNYTKSGLEVTFRPHRNKKKKTQAGEAEPLHASTKPFFGESKKIFQTEGELRHDSWKWENCIHAEKTFLGTSLYNPVFDIHYNARSEGHDDSKGQELQYALVITVEAPKVKDLYDQIVRKYATLLEQLQPIIDIPLKV